MGADSQMIGLNAVKAALRMLFVVAGMATLSSGAALAQTDGGDALPSLLGGGDRIVIGGGLPFGLYYPIAGTLCRTMESPDNAGCAVAPLSDSAAALRALQDGKVDMAIVQSDWLHHAVNGTSRFQDAGPADDLMSVAALHGEAFVFVTRTSTPPLVLKDLEGRRIEAGPENSYRGLLGRVALGAGDIDEDDIAVMGTAALPQAMTALCQNQTDAVSLMAAHPSDALVQAAATCDAVPMSFTKPTVDALLRLLPGYAEITIPAGTYETQVEPARTVGVRAVLVTTRNADPAMVGKVAAALKANVTRLAAAHRALNGLTISEMQRASAFAPLHPAAAQVFLGQSGTAE